MGLRGPKASGKNHKCMVRLHNEEYKIRFGIQRCKTCIRLTANGGGVCTHCLNRQNKR